jgi:4-hydroxybenzoate polyprenyltransferase
MNAAFYVILFLAELFAVWMLIRWQPDDPADCLKRFRANRDFGLIIFIALLAGRML